MTGEITRKKQASEQHNIWKFFKEDVMLRTAFILIFFVFNILNAGNLEDHKSLYEGPEVKTAGDLAAYTGLNAVDRIAGAWRQKCYVMNYEQLAVNYGNNVDFQLRQAQIILCPQTADFLYQKYIPKPRYQKGSRPELEKIVAGTVKGAKTTQAKALAIMRFCRDLKNRAKVKPGSNAWVFGGTEEELIAKGEDLCETVSRLFVALCEIADIPARIIMHDAGGHITAEAYIDGHWGYIDPRFGIYFMKDNKQLASLWELMHSPALLNQPKEVKAEVRGAKNWTQRIKTCKEKYFNPQEINGFEYYSLADSAKYRYGTVTANQAKEAGLFGIHKIYMALSNKVFGLPVYIEDYFWTPAELRKVPLSWRNDGFSPWFDMKAPVSPETINKNCIAPFKNSNVEILIWGTGPGSTFTHNTKVGEVFGYAATNEHWKKKLRPRDINVFRHITGLIQQGINPIEMIVNFGHESGLKVYSRLEMNHEYGPADPENWKWIGFVGEFNKKHPEYRQPRKVLLDYKHNAVRDFKLAVLQELAQRGVDGLELDFAVYPPFFAKVQTEIMTGFVRDVRRMLDEEAKKQGHKITLQVSLQADTAIKEGLNWPLWMKEKLVERVLPAHIAFGVRRAEFDIRIGDFIRLGKQTGCEVWGRCFQSLLIFSRDPQPDRIARYSRVKMAEEFYAQALMYLRSGVDGIELAQGSNVKWKKDKKYFNTLGDPAIVEFADKNYLVDPFPYLTPFVPSGSKNPEFYSSTKSVHLRVADNISKAKERGYNVKSFLIINVRPLKPGEKMEIFLNGNGPLLISGDDPKENQRNDKVIANPSATDLTVPNWWMRGEHELMINPEWLWMGENIIRIVYSTKAARKREELQVLWPEVRIRYNKK